MAEFWGRAIRISRRVAQEAQQYRKPRKIAISMSVELVQPQVQKTGQAPTRWYYKTVDDFFGLWHRADAAVFAAALIRHGSCPAVKDT